jgi:hypothetical protein
MYENCEIKEKQESAAVILKALAVREICQGNPWLSHLEATRQHMGMVAYDGTEAVTKERELLKQGESFYEDGFRYNETHRQMSGLTHIVPDDAIAWVLVSAGHLATVECDRLVYITKIAS